MKSPSPFYREDKRGSDRWRVTSPRSQIRRWLEARFNFKVPTLKSKPLQDKRTKAGTHSGRGETRALPRGGAKPRMPKAVQNPHRELARGRAGGRGGRPRVSCRSPGPALRRRAPCEPRPYPWPGGKGTRALSRYPPPAGWAGEAGRAGEAGGARSRAACSRTSPGFGCVGPAARPLPPPSPRSRFAGRRLRGLGPGQAAAVVAGMPRVYIGRLSYQARERDVERFFKGYGKILEVDLKNG